jgi:two-component system NarL family response regulator
LSDTVRVSYHRCSIMKKDSDQKFVKPIRILIAEDHEIVREGIAAILNTQTDMIVVAQATNGQEAVRAFNRERPDIALLDLMMPEMSGVEATVAIKRKFPNARIVVLTTYDGDEDIYRALQAGARAYLLKDTSRNDIFETIRAVHRGERRIPAEIAARLAERVAGSELTKRELDVLKQIVKGKSNKEIASVLNITEGTVKYYVNVILSKMGVSDRTEAATTALKRGLVHPDCY